MKYHTGKKEVFSRQTVEIALRDAIMQRSNLMLILYEKNTMIRSVLISINRNELFFEMRILRHCSFEHFNNYNSKNLQPKMWIINLKIVLYIREKMLQSEDQKQFFAIGVFAEVRGSSILIFRIEVVG